MHLDQKQLVIDFSHAVTELLSVANLHEGDLFVIGCSTSEVAGQHIGQASVVEIGQALVQTVLPILDTQGIYLAGQCCEHLNRALVISTACAKAYGLEVVNVIPQPKAGGSFATACYQYIPNPVVVESIAAHAGLDIGDTFIGMHIKAVAVPVRLQVPAIGQAHLTAVRRRPKYIGGERAVYAHL